MNEITKLTHQQEIDLLILAQKGKTKQEREKATRLLIYYNQPFVKYLISGYHYPRGEINPEDLATEGSIALLKAIENFDLSKAKKYRLASYAGYWIHQRSQSAIKKQQMFSQIPKKKEAGIELDEEGKEIPPRKRNWGIIYYDRKHQDNEDDKAVSLLDTLAEEDYQIERQINKRDLKKRINSYLDHLEKQDNLLIRLFFGIAPLNLAQIYPLASSTKQKELVKLAGKQKMENIVLAEKENNSLIRKYMEMLSLPRKKEEVAKLINQKEFWDYFASFSKLAIKNNDPSLRNNRQKKTVGQKEEIISSKEKEKWIEHGIAEKDIQSWINLGYQAEDASDPQNHLCLNIGITKVEKEQWQKSNKTKIKNWLEVKLAKLMENRRKNILVKLQRVTEKKSN